MEHLGYLFAAYSIIFGVIFLYVLFIWRRQAAPWRAACRSVTELRARIGVRARRRETSWRN